MLIGMRLRIPTCMRLTCDGQEGAVNPDKKGSKVTAHYRLTINRGECQVVRLQFVNAAPHVAFIHVVPAVVARRLFARLFERVGSALVRPPAVVVFEERYSRANRTVLCPDRTLSGLPERIE
jgi:hypothetical protein